MGSSIPVAFVLGVVVYEFVVSLTGLMWLISRIKFPTRRDAIIQNLLFWPIVGWFSSVLISRLVNGGAAYQFAHDIAFIRFPLFVVAMVDLSDRIPVHRYLLRGLLAGIGYAGLNLFIAHILGFDLMGKPLSRYLSKLKEGARIGGMSAYTAPLLLLWAIFDRQLGRRRRSVILLFGFLGALLLVISHVRTALMAAIIGLVGGVLSQLMIRKRLKPGVVIALIIFAALGACGVLWAQPSVNSLYDRLFFWKVSWHLWLQNPVFGVGISSFNEAYRLIAESGTIAPVVAPDGTVFQSVNPRHAHNLFLQLMTCNGLLGLGAFFWVLWRAIKIHLTNYDSWRAGLSSWLFICIGIGLTGWNIYDPFYTTLFFYFLALIAISAHRGGDAHFVRQPFPV